MNGRPITPELPELGQDDFGNGIFLVGAVGVQVMKGNESEKRNGNREDTTIHTLHPRCLVRSSGKPITMTTITTTIHKTTSILQTKIKKQSMLPGTFRFPFGPGGGEIGGREKAEDRAELQRAADGVELLALAAAKIQG